jgi:short-subunit dehydrogenase
MELRGDGVRTMLVCPGYVTTGFQEHVRSGRAPDVVVRARSRAITPAACARAIRRGVERDARTILAPRAGWLLVALARLFPRAVEARMAAMNGTA